MIESANSSASSCSNDHCKPPNSRTANNWRRAMVEPGIQCPPSLLVGSQHPTQKGLAQVKLRHEILRRVAQPKLLEIQQANDALPLNQHIAVPQVAMMHHRLEVGQTLVIQKSPPTNVRTASYS